MMFRFVGVTGIFTLLVACAGNPDNATLSQAEAELMQMRAIAGIEDAAASHVDAAEREFKWAQQLHEMGRDEDLVDHHATLAMKHAEIAQEREKLQSIQAEVRKADERRQSILLDSSRRDVIEAQGEASAAEARAAVAARVARAATAELVQVQAEASSLAAELEAAESRASERGTVFTLTDVVFATDSAALLPGAQRTMARVGSFLRQYPEREVLVEGFTDSRGDEQYNRKLSLKRAEAVKAMLVAEGVEAERLRTAGLGEAFPVASNATPSGQQQNRRVDIILANADNSEIPSKGAR